MNKKCPSYVLPVVTVCNSLGFHGGWAGLPEVLFLCPSFSSEVSQPVRDIFSFHSLHTQRQILFILFVTTIGYRKCVLKTTQRGCPLLYSCSVRPTSSSFILNSFSNFSFKTANSSKSSLTVKYSHHWRYCSLFIYCVKCRVLCSQQHNTSALMMIYFKYIYLSAFQGGQFLLEYVGFQRQHSSSITMNKNVLTNILLH